LDSSFSAYSGAENHHQIDHLQNTTFWIVATIEKGVFCKWSIVINSNNVKSTAIDNQRTEIVQQFLCDIKLLVFFENNVDFRLFKLV
jgi:hypothetical protein